VIEITRRYFFRTAEQYYLLLVATLVTSLTKKLAVLLLRHTLASLLDYRTHTDLTKIGCAAGPATDTKTPF
jgi:hypothetical protein